MNARRPLLTTAITLGLAAACAPLPPAAAQSDDAEPAITVAQDRGSGDRAGDSAERRFRRDRGDGGSWRDRARRQMPELTAEQRTQLLEVLRDFNPQWHQRAQQFVNDNPQRAEFMLRAMYPRMKERIELKQKDPAHYQWVVEDAQLTFKGRELARKIRKAQEDGDSATAEKLTMELRNLLEKHFDVRQKLREKQVIRLQEQIRKVKADLNEHATKKQSLIDEQLQRYLTGEPDGPPPMGGPGPGMRPDRRDFRPDRPDRPRRDAEPTIRPGGDKPAGDPPAETDDADEVPAYDEEAHLRDRNG
jgi:hypothetical protein